MLLCYFTVAQTSLRDIFIVTRATLYNSVLVQAQKKTSSTHWYFAIQGATFAFKKKFAPVGNRRKYYKL